MLLRLAALSVLRLNAATYLLFERARAERPLLARKFDRHFLFGGGWKGSSGFAVAGRSASAGLLKTADWKKRLDKTGEG